MTPPEPSYDDTSGLEGARKAAKESKKRRETDKQLVNDVDQQINVIRGIRERNHFADQFRQILRGNS